MSLISNVPLQPPLRGCRSPWGGESKPVRTARTIFLMGLAIALTACTPAASPSQAALQAWLGTNLADVQVQTLEGTPTTLAQVAQTTPNQPLVINVWATWCPPCVQELPSLSELATTTSLTVVAIATDATAEAVTQFLAKHPLSPRIVLLHDPLGRTTRQAMGAVGLPTTLVTNHSLTVVLAEAGERNWAHPSMLAKIQSALTSE